MVHLILFTAFGFSVIIYKRTENRERALLFGFIILALFSAFRYGFGNDYFGYEEIFLAAQNGINSKKVELLFYYLNLVFPSYQSMIATLSLLYLAAVYGLIMKYTSEKFGLLSLLIFLINPYLFLMSLSAIRQTLVITFFIMFLIIEPKGKITRIALFITTIVVSFFIHQTVILLLPFYFVLYSKQNTKRDNLIFGLLPLIILIPTNVLLYPINWVVQFMPSRLNYLHYLQTNTPNTLRATLLYLLYYVYVLLNLRKLDKKTYPLAKLYLCGLLFALFAYKFSMFTRFLSYFEVLGIIALPAIMANNLAKERNRHMRLIHGYLYPSLLLFVFVLRYYSFFTNKLWLPFFEYRTVLSNWL